MLAADEAKSSCKVSKKLKVKSIKDVIIAKNGCKIYHIEWQDSWETENDLIEVNCANLLTEFWEVRAKYLQEMLNKQIKNNENHQDHGSSNKANNVMIMLPKLNNKQMNSTASFHPNNLNAFLPADENTEKIRNKNERKQQQLNMIKSERKVKTIYCKLCPNKIFAGKESLSIHQTLMHAKLVTCASCRKQFKNQLKLKRHEKKYCHNLFNCKFCKSSFIKNHDLKRHTTKKHSKEICDNNTVIDSFPVNINIKEEVIEDVADEQSICDNNTVNSFPVNINIKEEVIQDVADEPVDINIKEEVIEDVADDQTNNE